MRNIAENQKFLSKAGTINIVNTVPMLLKIHAGQRFKAREIAELIREQYPDACEDKLRRSEALKTEADLIQQIVAEIGATRPRIQALHPQVRTTESRPRRYYWSEKSEETEVAEAEAVEAQTTVVSDPVVAEQSDRTIVIATEHYEPVLRLVEHDLYPMLGAYLNIEFGVAAMRIDERRATNSRGLNGNRWLFPDVVGLQDLTHGWHNELKQCVSHTGDARAKLWSFEVKKLINRSNVREVFFQAVSNSSWANIAYLVAAEIEGSDTMGELRMLYALHGIGLIRLDVENPAESQVLIPARERSEVDWSSCNRLVSENADFRTYVKRVRQFYQTGDMPTGWNLKSD